MGSDGIYTGLVLGLINSINYPKEEKFIQSIPEINKNPSSKFDNTFLTLALSDETNRPATISDVYKQLTGEPYDILLQASSASAVSSFSNSSSFKRDRDFCDSDEIEAETEVGIQPISSKVSEEEEDGTGSPRKKLRLTKDQSAILEFSFKEHATLNHKQKQDLARKLSLSTRQVEVWFQNRRARTKLKQTEESCELLKKCCESLTEENKRLKKALQDMKTLKSAPHPPFYMQLKSATLSICPSCEGLCSVGDGSSPTSTLSGTPNVG